MLQRMLENIQPIGAGTFPATSAASWPAIIAGAFVAVASSLLLLSLGSGLGFGSVSFVPGRGLSAKEVAATAAIWLILTQWISACLGGYIAGRLRTRWLATHTHEVFFRDTAHGLIMWAVSTVLMMAIFAMTLDDGGLIVASKATAAAPTTAGYEVDQLLRPGENGGISVSPDPRPEVTRLVAHATAAGSMPEADRAYLIKVVAADTGISQQDAMNRVNVMESSVMATEAKGKEAAEAARKRAAEASIYLALSLLVGAFIASVSAALGGRLRDLHP